MRSRWDDAAAAAFPGPLGECVYGSRLLGADPDLVLAGGGNTSVKARGTDVFGRSLDVLHVKGSGWDLATIEAAGFAPLRLDDVRALAELEQLSDPEMVNALRCARLDASAPDPSVEAILHAVLPFPAVQHSHADVIVALTNTADGDAHVKAALGGRVVRIPYVMPGFALARRCAERFGRDAGPDTVGMVLANHGLFTFGASTRQAYERHVELITLAEQYLAERAGPEEPPGPPLPAAPVHELAELRRRVSAAAGAPMVLSRHTDGRTARFVRRADLAAVTGRGPATPDHVIRTKRIPLVGSDVDGYAARYRAYVEQHRSRASAPIQELDPAPRVVLDRELGMLTAGRSRRDADVAAAIYSHTMRVIEQGQALGGYRALPAADLFDVEYWDLEQAKLRRAAPRRALDGEVAVVTGAASGIGRACARALLDRGAYVVGVDRAPGVADAFPGAAFEAVTADVTEPGAAARAVETAAAAAGGVDMVVAAAGVFGASRSVADFDPAAWRDVMAVNAEAVAQLLAAAHPCLCRAPNGGRVVVVGSRNVPAPGPGAAVYSASKAAVTQVARVAALEWAGEGIRVHVVHPDAVYDTGLWTPELLAERAARYGLSVEEYKRRNLLRTEVASSDVANVVTALLGPAFRAVTGAQVPVDGGSDRVV